MVYSALNQSQYGAIDQIGVYTFAGLVQFTFISGEDKIDLSGLNLGATNSLLINAIISIDRTGIGSQITDSNAPNFFHTTTGDPTTQQRAVVVEFDGDDLDGAHAGTQSMGRIFIDLNGDGQLNTLQDMFIDYWSDDPVIIHVGSETPTFNDFIFVT